MVPTRSSLLFFISLQGKNKGLVSISQHSRLYPRISASLLFINFMRVGQNVFSSSTRFANIVQLFFISAILGN